MSSVDRGEQGKWWEAKDYALEKTQASTQGATPVFQAKQQVSRKKGPYRIQGPIPKLI